MSQIKAIYNEDETMKVTIEQDGAVVTLDDMEVGKIYRLRRAYYHRADLIHKIKDFCDESDWSDEIFRDDEDVIEVGSVNIKVGKIKELIKDNDFMDELVSRFDEALDENDSYLESFWTTAYYIVEDAFEKKMKEKNNENV